MDIEPSCIAMAMENMMDRWLNAVRPCITRVQCCHRMSDSVGGYRRTVLAQIKT